MTFVRIVQGPYKAKVCDPDRHIELASLGGGSSGTRYFRMSSQFDAQEFSGRTLREISGPSQSQLDAGIKEVIHWEMSVDERMFRFGQEADQVCSLRELIVEAFKLFGYAADATAEEFIAVTFRN